LRDFCGYETRNAQAQGRKRYGEDEPTTQGLSAMQPLTRSALSELCTVCSPARPWCYRQRRRRPPANGCRLVVTQQPPTTNNTQTGPAISQLIVYYPKSKLHIARLDHVELRCKRQTLLERQPRPSREVAYEGSTKSTHIAPGPRTVADSRLATFLIYTVCPHCLLSHLSYQYRRHARFIRRPFCSGQITENRTSRSNQRGRSACQSVSIRRHTQARCRRVHRSGPS
jgi:hypothetical protein